MKRMALVFLAVLVTFSAMAFAYKIGIVLDTGGRGDLSFNDAAYAGVEKAVTDFGLDGIVFVESKTAADYLPNLRAQAKQDDIALIIGVGFLLQEAMATVATEFPNKKFAIIDQTVPGATNVLGLIFREGDGSALIGALGAMLALEQGKTDIGVIFGIEGSVMYHFEAGYRFGIDWGIKRYAAQKALATAPKLTLHAPYTGSFGDIALGKTTMEAQLADGVIGSYNVAGGLGIGMMQAIAQAHANAGTATGAPYYFGVDQDQDWWEKGQFCLMSMLKRVDLAAYEAVRMVVEGTFAGGSIAYGIKEGGVYVSTAKDLVEAVEPRVASGTIPAADKYVIYENWAENRAAVPVWIWAAIDELNAKILSGEITVPFCETKTQIEAVRTQYPLN